MQVEIPIPGSKSITNRVLALSFLCGKKLQIKNAAVCDDARYMIQGLRKLGAKINQKGAEIEIERNTVTTSVFKKNQKFLPVLKIYTGNAGTATRFLTALAALSGKAVEINGTKRMRQRPIAPLAKALNTLGANVKTTNDCLPLKIAPQKLIGGKVSLPGNISSQYISALLMAAPFAKKNTIIIIKNKLYSKPYIKMTIDLLKQFGIKIVNKNFEQFKVKAASPHSRLNRKSRESFKIESDASSASYFGAYAALHPQKTVLLKNIHKNSIQGDIKFLQYLQKMGCKIFSLNEGIKITGPKKLKSLKTIDMNETPDLVMTFAILAIFTPGKTKITNIANLKIKETDRLAALKNEIKKLGIKVKTGKNYIEIQGDPEIIKTAHKKYYHRRKTNPVKPSTIIKTYNDHRIAMCFAVIQDLIPHLKIKNPICVSKSYPNFWKDLKNLQCG